MKKVIPVTIWACDLNNRHSITVHLKSDPSWDSELISGRLVLEIPEKKVPLTRSAVNDALEKRLGNVPNLGHRFEDILEDLGL